MALEDEKLAAPQARPERFCQLTLEAAKELGQCRVCGLTTRDGRDMPVKLSYGREHAHMGCLERLSRQPENNVTEPHSAFSHPYPGSTDAQEASASVRSVVDERVQGELRPNYYRVRVPAVESDTGRLVVVEVECFQMIRALGLGFFDGNVLKYLWRAGRKTKSRLEDAKKVLTYAKQALLTLENEERDRPDEPDLE